MRQLPIPAPPAPPSEPMPTPGTGPWVDWHMRHSFSVEDALLIEWCYLHDGRDRALMAYVDACHHRRWAGWQATLAWALIEHVVAPLDDDIPF